MNPTPKGFAELVADAKQQIDEIDIQGVKARLDDAEASYTTLIDIREESEWLRGHLPMANYIGRGVLEVSIERAVPDRKAPIILYCGGGSRSALAAESLQKMGYTNVKSMIGGFRAWAAAYGDTIVVPS